VTVLLTFSKATVAEAEAILRVALSDPAVSAKDKARYRRLLLGRTAARMEELAALVRQLKEHHNA
jgi:hypothetical protein